MPLKWQKVNSIFSQCRQKYGRVLYIMKWFVCGNWNRYPQAAEVAFVSNETINFLNRLSWLQDSMLAYMASDNNVTE
jgi:hypothetical protein